MVYPRGGCTLVVYPLGYTTRVHHPWVHHDRPPAHPRSYMLPAPPRRSAASSAAPRGARVRGPGYPEEPQACRGTRHAWEQRASVAGVPGHGCMAREGVWIALGSNHRQTGFQPV